MVRKTLLNFVAISLIVFISCTNDDTSIKYEAKAKIIGSDVGMCACCGGYLIRIEGEEVLKNFSELPKNSNIDLQNADFPIDVNLNWTTSNEVCSNFIIITDIEKY